MCSLVVGTKSLLPSSTGQRDEMFQDWLEWLDHHCNDAFLLIQKYKKLAELSQGLGAIFLHVPYCERIADLQRDFYNDLEERELASSADEETMQYYMRHGRWSIMEKVRIVAEALDPDKSEHCTAYPRQRVAGHPAGYPGLYPPGGYSDSDWYPCWYPRGRSRPSWNSQHRAREQRCWMRLANGKIRRRTHLFYDSLGID